MKKVIVLPTAAEVDAAMAEHFETIFFDTEQPGRDCLQTEHLKSDETSTAMRPSAAESSGQRNRAVAPEEERAAKPETVNTTGSSPVERTIEDQTR